MSADLLALIERLVDDDPMTHSQEGLDDCCFHCGSWTRYDTPQPHFADCAWIEATELLGRDHPDHVIDETRAHR